MTYQHFPAWSGQLRLYPPHFLISWGMLVVMLLMLPLLDTVCEEAGPRVNRDRAIRLLREHVTAWQQTEIGKSAAGDASVCLQGRH